MMEVDFVVLNLVLQIMNLIQIEFLAMFLKSVLVAKVFREVTDDLREGDLSDAYIS
ncbi:MAG: hypothetical protein EZS28_025958, partial [Streblomastix strix]